MSANAADLLGHKLPTVPRSAIDGPVEFFRAMNLAKGYWGADHRGDLVMMLTAQSIAVMFTMINPIKFPDVDRERTDMEYRLKWVIYTIYLSTRLVYVDR